LPLVSTDEESVNLPLVINVVAKYWGEELAPQIIGEPEANRKGTILIEGIELAENHDFSSYIYRGSIKDLKRRIDQGIPLIVVMPGIHAVVQHATVVSGYDNQERRIFTYVPEPNAVGAVPESKFEQDWLQDDMTTIAIVPEDMKDIFKNEKLEFAESNRLCFEAERLRQLRNIPEATAKLNRAAEIDDDNPQVWCLLAGIYNETGSQDPVTYYQKAIGLNPSYYLAYRGLGNLYLKSREFALAESYYSKAIAINATRFGPIYKNRAIARIELGDKFGAKEDLISYLHQTPYAEDRKSIEEAMLQL
jgi:tetratricopeptide (TPR) repeat protein